MKAEFNPHVNPHIEHLQKTVNPDLATGAEELLLQAQKAVLTAQQRAGTISASEEFTTSGKRKQLAAVGAEASANFARIVEQAKGYTANIAQLESKLQFATPQRKPEEQMAYLLRQREIRDRLQGKDAVVLQNVYLEAIDQRKDELAEAMEEAPQGFTLLPVDIVAQGRRRRAELQNPEVAAKLRDLYTVRDTVEYAIREMRKDVERMTGSLIETPKLVWNA